MVERFYSKSNQGATAVADRIQSTKRPGNISESHDKLTTLKRLLKEFERHNLQMNHSHQQWSRVR